MSSETRSKLSELKALMSNTHLPDRFDIPDGGRISMSDIRDGLGMPAGRVSLRAAGDVMGHPSGRIAMSDFYGYKPFHHTLTVGTSGVEKGFSRLGVTMGEFQPRNLYYNPQGAFVPCTALHTFTNRPQVVRIDLNSAFTGTIFLEGYSSQGVGLQYGSFQFQGSQFSEIVWNEMGGYLSTASNGEFAYFNNPNNPREQVEAFRERMRQLRISNGLEPED